MSIEEFLATAAAAAVGAFVAAYLGFRYAMTRLKKERAFDRRLEWYENTCRLLTDVAGKLNWAAGADLVGGAPEERARAWAEENAGLASLRGIEVSAEMYASDGAYQALAEAMNDVTSTARSVWIASRVANTRVDEGRLYEICRKLLYHAASRLATDIRDHLDLEPVSSEWRLYDQELRQAGPHTEAARLEPSHQ